MGNLMNLDADALRGHIYHHSLCTTTRAPAAFIRSALRSDRANGKAVLVIHHTEGSYLHAYAGSSLPAPTRPFSEGAIL